MIIKLKDLCELKSGFQGRPEEGDDFKIIKLKDVLRDEKVSFERLETFSSERMNEKYLLKRNDILFKAKSGDNTAVLYEGDGENIVASAHFFILNIKKQYKDKVNPSYLTMYLNSEYAQEYFKKHSEGTALSIVKLSSLSELEIKVPNREQQEKLSQVYSLMIEEKVLMQMLLERREKQVKAYLRNVIEG
jgi:restriction endonuclease S subunit